MTLAKQKPSLSCRRRYRRRRSSRLHRFRFRCPFCSFGRCRGVCACRGRHGGRALFGGAACGGRGGRRRLSLVVVMVVMVLMVVMVTVVVVVVVVILNFFLEG